MPKFRLEYLYTLYLQEKISPEEYNELIQFIADASNEDDIMDIIEAQAEHIPYKKELSEEASKDILNKILQKNTETEVLTINRKSFFRGWASIAAACILAIGILSVWIKLSNTKKNISAPINQQTTQILPGSNKAFLTLHDGKVINLNEITNNTDTANNNITLETKDGILIYKTVSDKKINSQYNKLTTPRGGQYQVLLPDGTSVWLNAASSIRYPVTFSDKERVVELTGEAFFNVKKLYKKNKKGRVPFKINVKSSSGDDAVIEVLGTSFNVSAYENENMFKVTLKHGAVKVEKGKKIQLLKPGEEAEVYNNNHISLVKNADMEHSMAWKKGIFLFENDDIKSIMKQISRWYDVEIIYNGLHPTARFDGKINRNANISDVLQILKLSGVEFTIKDKTILVQ